ncbi:hypothetical protein TNCV_4164091 [Trichonephila clavipes]|nr:hypothetical protein TNCV_4164091 [Trichonephila clavipes]
MFRLQRRAPVYWYRDGPQRATHPLQIWVFVPSIFNRGSERSMFQQVLMHLSERLIIWLMPRSHRTEQQPVYFRWLGSR